MRSLGIEAYSCDIEPCSGGHPELHIQDDVMSFFKKMGFNYCISTMYISYNSWNKTISNIKIIRNIKCLIQKNLKIWLMKN
jgi:hypothetical protein